MCFLIKDMVDIVLLFNANLEGLCLTRRIHAVKAMVPEWLTQAGNLPP